MTSFDFVDSNILLRYILADDPVQSPAAKQLFESIESGSKVVQVSDTVLFETVYVLQSQFRVPRHEIAKSVLAILALPGIMLEGKSSYRQVCDIWTTQNALSFADCFHAVFAMRFARGVVISFDRGFDRIPGVKRREPAYAQ